MSKWTSTKELMPPSLTGMVISDVVLVLDENDQPALARWHKRETRWIIQGYRNDEPLPGIKYWMKIPKQK